MPAYKIQFTKPKFKVPSVFILIAKDEATAIAAVKKKHKDASNIKISL